MTKETSEIVYPDFGAVARKIYELDPEWTWDKDQVQHTIPFDKLPAKRILELVEAAKGFLAFANTFERDVPLSGVISLFNELNRFGAKIDEES